MTVLPLQSSLGSVAESPVTFREGGGGRELTNGYVLHCELLHIAVSQPQLFSCYSATVCVPRRSALVIHMSQ